MKDIRLALRRFKAEAIEAGIADGSVIVARHVAIERGDSLNAHGEQVMGVGLEEGKRVRSDLADLGEKSGVADFAKTLDFLLAIQTRQMILLVGVDASDVAANRFGERRLGQKFGPRRLAQAGDEAVFAESGAIV